MRPEEVAALGAAIARRADENSPKAMAARIAALEERVAALEAERTARNAKRAAR